MRFARDMPAGVRRHAERASNFREMNEVIISPPEAVPKISSERAWVSRHAGHCRRAGEAKRGFAMKSDPVG